MRVEVVTGRFLQPPFRGGLADTDGSLVGALCVSTCKASSELQGEM
jgi:hypothetical protein